MAAEVVAGVTAMVAEAATGLVTLSGSKYCVQPSREVSRRSNVLASAGRRVTVIDESESSRQKSSPITIADCSHDRVDVGASAPPRSRPPGELTLGRFDGGDGGGIVAGVGSHHGE